MAYRPIGLLYENFSLFGDPLAEDSVWITGKVDLPREVIDAHREGRLVLFVGAGASFDHPSNLQTFDDLASSVAKRFGASDEILTRFRSRPDGLLGYLATRDPQPGHWPVHELVKEILADPASKPNANHEAIMRIAAASPVMRIVTTNFDDHLASHAAIAHIPIPNVYVGPALPLGRNFSGLVHLHGSVLRPASEFVLTDADFGAAYLTESWAARFLYPMFSNFVVLFVGYSMQDIVMSYLARGLPESQSRYALTPDPDGSDWRSLNIKPIGYLPLWLKSHWLDRGTHRVGRPCRDGSPRPPVARARHRQRTANGRSHRAGLP